MSAAPTILLLASSAMQSQPDQALDVLRSGMSMPGVSGADAARLHLAVAHLETSRSNWVGSSCVRWMHSTLPGGHANVARRVCGCLLYTKRQHAHPKCMHAHTHHSASALRAGSPNATNAPGHTRRRAARRCSCKLARCSPATCPPRPHQDAAASSASSAAALVRSTQEQEAEDPAGTSAHNLPSVLRLGAAVTGTRALLVQVGREGSSTSLRVCVCACVCVCVCVCMCVRARVRACVRACVVPPL